MSQKFKLNGTHNWPIKPLAEVTEIIAGQSPPSITYNKNKIGLPFYQGKADFGITFPVVRMWCSAPVKLAKTNDILISVRAPVGPTNLCDSMACIGRGLSAIRSSKLIYYKFLFYYLRSIEKMLSDQGRGSTFSAITQSELKHIIIPLPPLPIQKQIAEILEKADQAKQKRQEANQLTEQFLQSSFIEMFGDPNENPKKWRKIKVIEFCKCIVPGRDKPKNFTGHIPWVTTNDLSHLSYTSFSKINYGLTDKEITEVRAKIIPPGSVLMTCVGDLGIISIANNELVINQQLHSFQCSDKINNIFLMYCLSFLKAYMIKMSSSTTVPYMNKTVCNSIPIIFPPLSIQKEFAGLFQKVEALKEKQKQSEQELDNLFNSLMQKAFQGDLF